jgi:DNA polymerase-3 subunit alpha
MGIEVLPPDINQSFQRFTVVNLDSKPAIRFGLTAVKNVGEHVVQNIIIDREHNGLFKDIEEFVSRIASKDLNKKSLESLIKCGAMDAFGERSVLLANMDNLLSYARDKQKHHSTGQVSLFGGSTEITMPPLRLIHAEPVANREKLMWEKELLGLFVSAHPLNEYQAQLALEKVTQIKDLNSKAGTVKISGIVTKTQKIITKTGKPMLFSWIEDLGAKIEVVVFPNVLERYPDSWKENSIVIAKGKINDRDGSLKLLCDDCKILATLA